MYDLVVHTFYSKQGHLLWLKPLQESDVPYLVNLFDHLSPESRYLRFQTLLPHLPPEYVWQEAPKFIPGPDRPGAGWLAFCHLPHQPFAPVAGVRFMYLSPTTAELSVTVRDELQGCGIGRELVHWLFAQAQQAQVQTLVAETFSHNLPMLNLFVGLAFPKKVTTQTALTKIEFQLS